MLTVFVANSPS